MAKKLLLKPTVSTKSQIPLENEFRSCDFIWGLVFANLSSLLHTGLKQLETLSTQVYLYLQDLGKENIHFLLS